MHLCHPSVPPPSLLTPVPPTAPRMPGPGGLTVGGTPGRRSCWGIPGGRFGCLPRPRCTAAAPAPERRPAFRTAKTQRAVSRRGRGEQQAPNLRPGDPLHQAMGDHGAPGESSAEGSGAISCTWWHSHHLGLPPHHFSLPHFLSITRSMAPTSQISPHLHTSLHYHCHCHHSPPSSTVPMITTASYYLPTSS